MKKKLLAISVLLILALTAGCQNSEVQPDENEIRLAVDISEIEEPVYRADMEYMLSSELMGGMAVSDVRTNPLKEQIVFSLDENCFPEGSKAENFSFYVVLSGDKNGINELFSSAEKINNSNECEVFNPQYGEVYYYLLTGNFTDGFELKLKTDKKLQSDLQLYFT
ncbi:MAG: hypothetical protein IKE93_07945 [Erysipelotrichaceae bacterium]|nr:hypothetical protein [Erysipelotrichaceae bacterium]